MDSFNADTNATEVLEKLGSSAEGKTFLITGTSKGGIGAEVAKVLASAKPKQLILAARNESKVTPVIDEIRTVDSNVSVDFVHLDLLSNKSVHEAVNKIKSMTSKIDGLVNNAGIMAPRQYAVSEDGVEKQFAANHLGHFLLTNLLIKEGIAGGSGSIIVNVGSLGYQLAEVNFDDVNYENGKNYNGWKAYGQAKTSNLLFTYSLGNRLKKSGVPVVAVHPGVVVESQLLANSGIDQEYFGEAYALAMERHKGNLPPQTTKTMSQGVACILAAILEHSIRDDAPLFLVENAKDTPWEYAIDETNQQKLWSLSEKLVGESFSP